MKLAERTRKVEMMGHVKEREFTIALGPHIMHVLSGLYSDIPWAIVREYGTNMLDAYVKMDKSREFIPPIFHAPNNLEPFLEFKDFGVGMDYDTVWEVFPSYGASTKRDNNDEVGGIGIGAKAAFCYEGADQWTVESRFEGIRYIFNAHKGGNDVPRFVLMDEVETDEPNGITVRIPVASRDISLFNEKLSTFLTFFPMAYEVEGAKLSIPTPEYVLKQPTWGLLKDGGTGYNTKWTAIVGNIPYPIDQYHLKNYDLNGVSLHIFLKVGDVDITPSRESLKYTDRTKQAVEAAVGDLKKEIRRETEKRIKDAPTKWEALCALKDAWGIYALREFVKKATWRGQELDATQGLVIPVRKILEATPSGTSLRSWNVSEYGSLDRITIPTAWSIAEIDSKYGAVTEAAGLIYHRVATPEQEPCLRISPYNKDSVTSIFMVDDRKQDRGIRSCVISFIEQETTQTYRGRRGIRRDSAFQLFTIKPPEGEEIDVKKLVDILEGFPISDDCLSQYEPTKEQRVANKVPVALKVWDSYEFRSTNIVDDGKEVFYYVKLDRRNLVHFSGLDQVRDYIGFVKKQSLLPLTFRLYGVPRTLKHIENKDNWIEFKGFVEGEVRKYWQRRGKSYLALREYARYEGRDMLTYLAGYDDEGNRPPGLTRLLQMHKRYQRVTRLLGAWLPMVKGLRLIPEEKDKTVDQLQQLLKPYPMVAALDNQLRSVPYGRPGILQFIRDNKEVIKEYIQERKIRSAVGTKRRRKLRIA